MPLVVVKTNLARSCLPSDLMQIISAHMVNEMKANEKVTVVEVHCGIPMLRNGTTDPIVNVEIHHKDNAIRDDTKNQTATCLASLLVQHLDVAIERVLVLFFDTRCTTMKEATTSL